MIKKSKIINKIHSIIIIYLLFGWIFRSQRVILSFILPLIQYQFLINNNMCILTQLENKFRKDEGETLEIESFIKKKLEKININLDDKKREKIVHSSIIISYYINQYLFLFY